MTPTRGDLRGLVIDPTATLRQTSRMMLPAIVGTSVLRLAR
jgi:hypothetical protein